MEYDEGSIAEDGAGNFMVYKYGAWHPSDEAGRPTGPIDASARWGTGARELPNGTVERVGPRGGVSTVANGSDADSEGVGKLTEGQGKAMLYGGMMAGAERDYQAARAGGYDPAGFRNQAARVAGVIPFDGDFFGRLIRDDVSDAGNQAELRWAEGNLRQLTGAAATNPEIARVAAINFDRGNDELADQRYRTRAETFEGTRYAAGPGASQLPDYPGAPDDTIAQGAGASMAGGGIGAGASGLAPGSYEPTDQLRGLDKDGNGQVSVEELEAAGFTFNNGQWTLGAPADGGRGAPPSVPSAPSGPDAGPSPAAVEGGRGRVGMILSGPSAFMRGAMEQGPFFQEAAAGIGALVTGQSYGDIRDGQNALARYDQVNNRDQRNLGGIAGASAGVVVPFGAPVRALRGANLASRVGNRALGGAAAGSLYSAGQAEGNALQRVDDALIGAGGGAVAGVAAPAVGNALGRYVARPVIEGVQSANRAVGRVAVNALDGAGASSVVPNVLREQVAPRPLESGMRRFADRSPQQVNALNANVSGYSEDGIDPAFLDVVNDGGRGMLNALATRQTPARTAAREFAQGRTRNLPTRARTIAEQEISSDTRPALEVMDAQRATRRANASAIDTFGNDAVPIPEGLSGALSSDIVRSALRGAASRASGAVEPLEREAAQRLTALAEGRASATALTVREAQDLSKALNDAATQAYRNGSPDGPVYSDLAKAIRQSARENSDGYANWLRQYGEDSDMLEAATTGRNFVSVSKNPIEGRSTQSFVNRAENASEPELSIQRAAAREAVDVAASNPSGARTTLEGFASDLDQQRRVAALGADPDRIAARSRRELDAVSNAQDVNPMTGARTNRAGQDQASAAGEVVGAAGEFASANVPGLTVRVGRLVRSRGFSDQEAEAIVTAAIDPARTNELVAMLAERMSRREARNLARVLRHQANTNLPSGRE